MLIILTNVWKAKHLDRFANNNNSLIIFSTRALLSVAFIITFLLFLPGSDDVPRPVNDFLFFLSTATFVDGLQVQVNQRKVRLQFVSPSYSLSSLFRFLSNRDMHSFSCLGNLNRLSYKVSQRGISSFFTWSIYIMTRFFN